MLENSSITKGFAWTAFETYSTQCIMFLVSIVMARLLSPSDYGLIGMITVFLCIADILIDSGFTQALIRKQECQKQDYSTVFYFNIIISCFIFTILYFTAPLIASFYKIPLLTNITRVMGLTFVISSLGAVSNTILIKELMFKKKALITFVCSVFSGIIGIYFAYNGWGVYALVLQTVLSAMLRMIITLLVVKWFPSFVFSAKSFSEMFDFGSKILVSNLIYTVYQNIYNIVVGRFFSPADLGYFTRADGYSKLIPTNINGVLMKVMLPYLAKVQDNDNELVQMNLRIVQLTSFIIFPATMFLAGAAYPIISIMISDKWLPSAPLLQILCVSVMFDHISTINWEFLLAKGRSDIILQQQLYTKCISILVLVITLFMGLKAVAIGKGISSLIFMASSFICLCKVLPVSVKAIMLLLHRILYVAIILGVGVFMAFCFLDFSLKNVIIIFIVSIVYYIVMAKILFPETLKHFVLFLKR